MWLAEKGSVKSWTSIKSDWKLAARNILFDYLFHFPYPNGPRGAVTMTITRKTPADGRLVQSICLALPMKTSWSLFPHFWRADSWCERDGLSGKGPSCFAATPPSHTCNRAGDKKKTTDNPFPGAFIISSEVLMALSRVACNNHSPRRALQFVRAHRGSKVFPLTIC